MAISHNELMGAKESIEIAVKMLQLAIDEAEGFEKAPQGGGDYDPPIPVPVPEPAPEPEPEPEPVAPGLPAGYLARKFKLSEFKCKCGGKGCNGYNGLSEAQAAIATKPLAERARRDQPPLPAWVRQRAHYQHHKRVPLQGGEWQGERRKQFQAPSRHSSRCQRAVAQHWHALGRAQPRRGRGLRREQLPPCRHQGLQVALEVLN